MSIKSYFKKLFKKKEEPLTSVASSVPSLTFRAGAVIPNALYPGSLQVSSGYSPMWQHMIDESNKKLNEQTIILNSFDNNVKVLYEDLKKYINNNNFQVYVPFGAQDLSKNIEVCEILDRHLKLNKFNKTLEDIINE